MGRRTPEDYQLPSSLKMSPPGIDLPVPRDGRDYCGDLNIRIDRTGRWSYNGTPITRKVMVSLFASILVRANDGVYWLVSPTEMGHIDVEDAPFIIVDMAIQGEGEDQIIVFTTNVDTSVTISEDNPLLMKQSPVTGKMTPYVVMPKNIDARIDRAVYYDLVEYGAIMDLGDEEILGVWSSGSFFPLGSMQDTDG